MYNVLIHRKNDEIKTKSQFTATATEPHRNRKIRQFNNDQYCNGSVTVVFSINLSSIVNYAFCLLFSVCTALAAPANGSVSINCIGGICIATFTCDTGFDLVGSAVLVCQPGQNWDGTPPSCERRCEYIR